MKLSKLLLVTLLVGCNSTTNEQATGINTNALDLTGDKSQTKNYWVVTKRDNPVYPTKAAIDGISGCVNFSFVISESGKAKNIQIIKSVPDGIFNRAATKSLNKFRWAATKNNSSLQPVLTTFQLDFSTSRKSTVAECMAS